MGNVEAPDAKKKCEVQEKAGQPDVEDAIAEGEEEEEEEEGEEEEEEANEGDVLTMAMSSMLTGQKMSELMREEGPVVTAVLLHGNGDCEEITVDMTPRLNSLVKLLGGSITFLGQYQDIDVVAVSLVDYPVLAPVNEYKLPPPLHTHDIKGDVILMRVNENAHPEDFKVDEWRQFISQDFTALKEMWDKRDQEAEAVR